MRFGDWLLAQTGRADPVGDLARDFRDDPERGRISTPLGLRSHLNVMGACDGAHDALTRAAKEFNRQDGVQTDGG